MPRAVYRWRPRLLARLVAIGAIVVSDSDLPSTHSWPISGQGLRPSRADTAGVGTSRTNEPRRGWGTLWPKRRAVHDADQFPLGNRLFPAICPGKGCSGTQVLSLLKPRIWFSCGLGTPVARQVPRRQSAGYPQVGQIRSSVEVWRFISPPLARWPGCRPLLPLAALAMHRPRPLIRGPSWLPVRQVRRNLRRMSCRCSVFPAIWSPVRLP